MDWLCSAMRSVQEIKTAINGLPKEDFWILAEWFERERNRVWDEQMQADAEAGRLDFLFEEAAAARQVSL
jgi:hypothetical protein